MLTYHYELDVRYRPSAIANPAGLPAVSLSLTDDRAQARAFILQRHHITITSIDPLGTLLAPPYFQPLNHLGINSIDWINRFINYPSSISLLVSIITSFAYTALSLLQVLIIYLYIS